MKYRIREKKIRNNLIIQYHKDNPEVTLSEIGDIFHLSRQRVAIILKNHDGEVK